jgi:3-oxoacyl-[acyl-carrier-protein] synthase-3
VAEPWRGAITGTGSYLPRRAVTNDDLASFLDTTDAWIRDRTGIGARRIAGDDEVTSDLAARAAGRAMGAAGVEASDVGLLVVATVTPDTPMPSCAVRVQHKLGLGPIPAFDLSAACAGFLYALTVADQFIRAGAVEHAVVVGVELLSRVVDWSDRTTAVLFGDGAGAVVLSRATEGGLLSSKLHADGSLADALVIPAGGSREPLTRGDDVGTRNKVHMVGQEIFRAAITRMTAVIEETLAAAGVTAEEVGAFVPHQANLRIIEAIAERLHVPLEKFVLTLDRYGNTSSASIPIALDEALRSGRLARSDRVMLSALGAGVAWGGVLLEL